ncbi:MAG: NTP transferase domain-containing protein [Candidatus Omnitrophica bacterium]|nr:NTP transferase domain-containing protein [Candidatus Omnitrophota bacterium]
MKTNLAVIILAAGQGKRLGGESQKVVKKISGRPMLLYLVNTIERLSPERIILIVGFKKEEIFEQMEGIAVEYAEQKVLRGTGDAVLQAKKILDDYRGDILILCGDVPFITGETLNSLIAEHRESGNCGTILTAFLDNPFGYGRIKRNGAGNVASIVEELNASEDEKAIKEINSGIYVFDKKALFLALDKVLPDEIKKEYYLTDVVKILSSMGEKMGTYTTRRPQECMGINNIHDFEEAQRFLSETGRKQ